MTCLFTHLLISIKVGETLCCSESDLVDSQDNLLTRRHVAYLTWVVMGVPKYPQLSEAEMYLPQNAASVALIKTDRSQRG